MKRFGLLFLFIILASATQIERDTLANGSVVLTVESHKIPVVQMKVVVYAGSVFDPHGKEGLANLVSQFLLRGTESHPASEMVEAIEFVGGGLSPFASVDYAGLDGKVLSKDLFQLIDLLSDCLQNPELDSMQLLGLKKEAISQIRASANDPFELNAREFRNLVFQDNPLAHSPEGYETSVATISMPDVREFYNRYYSPNNTFFVFVGDFDKDSLMVMLQNKFGDWQRQKLSKPQINEPIVSDHSIGKIIKMDISQAYIMLGNLGPKYGDADWHAARVMNFILGGAGLTSRIAQKIREEKGLAYDAYSRFYRFNTGGYYMARVQTRKEMANEVVQTLISEMKRMQDTIDIAELNRAKKFYIGSFPLTYSTFRDMAETVTEIESGNFGLDYLSEFEKFIEAVTIAEVKAAATKYLHPDRFYLLIVGDLEPLDITVEGIEWVK